MWSIAKAMVRKYVSGRVDSAIDFEDNTRSVEATVSVVQTPLPGALPLFVTGLGFTRLAEERS